MLRPLLDLSTFIQFIELLNEIYTLNKSLNNFSEPNLLKILLHGVGDLISHLQFTIKFIKKKTDHLSGPISLS